MAKTKEKKHKIVVEYNIKGEKSSLFVTIASKFKISRMETLGILEYAKTAVTEGNALKIEEKVKE